MIRQAAIVFGICLATLGCNRSPAFDPRTDLKGPSLIGSCGSWSGNDKEVAGIDFCSMYADHGFVIWGDFMGGSGGETHVDQKSFKCEGHLENTITPRKVHFTYQTTDGKSGRATIDGKEFDVSAGSVFLVATHNGDRILQLKRDVSQFQNGCELFASWAKHDPEVIKFFTTVP